MSEELKPCPFCGGEAVVGSRNSPFNNGGMRTNGPEWATVGCKKCCYYLCEAEDVFGRPPGRANKMFKLWNTRAVQNENWNSSDVEEL